FGPKRIRQVFTELGIATVAELQAAGADGRLAELKGFGTKLVAKILEGIDFLATAGQRVLYPTAKEWADRLIAAFDGQPGVVALSLAGSLRRLAPTIKDIDIVIASDDPQPLLDLFVALPEVRRVTGHGDTKASVVLQCGIAADLRVVSPTQFPFALNYFTGSKAHNVEMRARAQDRGLRLNEYELAGEGRSVACASEEDLYAALDLAYVPPELREGWGEIAAAEKGPFPRLVEAGDLSGTFHCHTNYSDGANTLAEMADAAREMDFAYLGIADHSQTAAYAGGLVPAKVKKQHAEIDTLNAADPEFRLFKGIESDILGDGRLDYDDETLATFDYVVASVHSQFNLTIEGMTERIVRAIRHPLCTMLGHATGRLLLRRDGYPVDVERVLAEAAKHGVMVEINANPNRLDLDWTACRRAKALGVGIVINPDAHSTVGLLDVQYGVNVARRAGLQSSDIFNCLPAEEIAKRLAARKEAAVAKLGAGT
ncbi:MAG TPA: PHP domain-containing protein, partial [Planctomycetia bacterium]|nr:PHP domain-containing protein [Planctomycetia bacterium]